MINYPHLATRLFNTPIAITPDKAEIVMASLADRFGIAHLFRAGRPSALMPGDIGDDDIGQADLVRYYDVVDGIAVIPVQGTLVQKLGCMRPWSGMTGYDSIRINVLQALSDEDVEAIILDIDSPGGEVAGCFDLVDTIYRARGAKPIWAICSEIAYSAAYAIASACDHITVPRTGGTGSVGVICMHVDFSKALDEAGITVSIIQYGARKADGAEVLPLSKEARQRFQADIDTMGDLFVQTVARNRELTPEAVKSTDASTFLGQKGVAIGFADAVMAPDAAFRALLKQLKN